MASKKKATRKRLRQDTKTDPGMIQAAENERKAVSMRMSGATFDQIARQLGYAHRSGAYKAVSRALRAVREEAKETAAELREIESQRLDYLLRSVDVRIRGETVRNAEGRIVSHIPAGDVQAVSEARRISESRRRLNGTDAPVKVESITPEDVERAKAAMAAILTDEIGDEELLERIAGRLAGVGTAED